MLFWNGVDLVKIERIANLYNKFSYKFANKILTKYELEKFALVSNSKQITFLAKRFAAKEAFVKALGCGFRDGIWLTSISVKHDKLGKPYIVYSKEVEKKIVSNSITNIVLSISDDSDYAIAFVCMEYNLKSGLESK